MNSKIKIWIRVIVLVGILSWPRVETYRLWVTTQKMVQAQALERSVRAKVEAARARHVQVVNAAPAPTTAESKP